MLGAKKPATPPRGVGSAVEQLDLRLRRRVSTTARFDGEPADPAAEEPDVALAVRGRREVIAGVGHGPDPLPRVADEREDIGGDLPVWPTPPA